jgi:hypothetical protein
MSVNPCHWSVNFSDCSWPPVSKLMSDDMNTWFITSEFHESPFKFSIGIGRIEFLNVEQLRTIKTHYMSNIRPIVIRVKRSLVPNSQIWMFSGGSKTSSFMLCIPACMTYPRSRFPFPNLNLFCANLAFFCSFVPVEVSLRYQLRISLFPWAKIPEEISRGAEKSARGR